MAREWFVRRVLKIKEQIDCCVLNELFDDVDIIKIRM